MIRIPLLLLVSAMLAACAANIPSVIRSEPAGNPPVAAVRADPQRFANVRVRWGGTIASVDNRAKETWIEIVSHDLASGGRPLENDRSQGRFMARIPGFLDPALFAKGRALTVAGVVAGQVTKLIGQYPYRFPVVKVQAYHLWQPLPQYQSPPYPPPWYYDPWYPYPYWPGWHRW